MTSCSNFSARFHTDVSALCLPGVSHASFNLNDRFMDMNVWVTLIGEPWVIESQGVLTVIEGRRGRADCDKFMLAQRES